MTTFLAAARLAIAGFFVVTSCPVAQADSAQYFTTPWGTRCEVTAATAACDTCEPGLLLDTPAAADNCGKGPGSDRLITDAAGVQQSGPAGILPPTPASQKIAAGQSYHANGWTVSTPISGSGVHFTNDATGHGMAVAPQNFYFY